MIIRVPSREIRELLPKDAAEVVNFSSLVHILSDAEATQAELALSRTASEINQQQGKYADQYSVKDETTGWYRLYGKDSDIFGWLMVKRQPPLSADDIVATCQRETSAVLTSCNLPLLVTDGIALMLTVRLEHLPYQNEIKLYWIRLVQSWRTKSETVRLSQSR